MSEQDVKDRYNRFINLTEDDGDIPDRFHVRVSAIDLVDIFGNVALDWIDGLWGDIDDIKISSIFSTSLNGFGGNDILIGTGLGTQALNGGSGDDIMLGVGTFTTMRGGSGRDVILGLAAENDVRGGKGDDFIGVLGASNIVKGGSGDDVIVATGAVNRLEGGNGDDVLVGLGGDNRLLGGLGKDIIVGEGGNNNVDGGRDNDTITVAGAANRVEGGEGNDSISALGGRNRLLGQAGDDAIVALGAANTIKGGKGSDVIETAGGANFIYGEAGHDTILTAGGANFIYGGAGNDTILTAAAENAVQGGGGKDEVIALGIDNRMWGGSGDDLLVAIGGTNFQWGGSGNDDLIAVGTFNLQRGEAGDDALWGFASSFGNLQLGDSGRDLLVGAGAGNLQHGGGGQDRLIAGGLGNIQVGSNGSDILVAAGSGNVQFGDQVGDIADALDNLVEISAEATSKEKHDAVEEGVNTIRDNINELVGRLVSEVDQNGTGNDVLIGGGSGNLQVGGAGRDMIFGGGVGNLQLGGASGDTMYGAGKGTLQYGGAGSDLMIGLGWGFGNEQIAGDGKDVMFGVGRGDIAGIQVQRSNGSDDFMLAYTASKALGTLAKIKAYADIANSVLDSESDADTNDLIKDHFQQRALQPLHAVRSVGVQVADQGDDVFFSSSGINVLIGGNGQDVAMLGSGYNRAVLGAADDLIITGDSSASIAQGGIGDDWLIGTNTLALFMAHAELSDDVVTRFRDGVGEAGNTLAGVFDTIQEVQDRIDELNPLSEVEETVDTVITQLSQWFDVSVSQYIGGAGDDVIAAGIGNADVVGGAGDDTYLFTFGDGLFNAGDHTIDEEGLDAPLDWADALDLDPGLLEDLGGEAGGQDVIEVRNWGWVEIAPRNLQFERILTQDANGQPAGENLRISFRTQQGTDIDGAGSVTVKNMDDPDARVEILRITSAGVSREFDLAAAYDAGLGLDRAFSLADYAIGEPALAPLDDAFETAWIGSDSDPGWGDQILDAFLRVPVANDIADARDDLDKYAMAADPFMPTGFYETYLDGF